jgi:membrane-bound lytic murein transglycosylase D
MYAYIQHEIDVKENPFRNSRAIAKVMKAALKQNSFTNQNKILQGKTRG